MKKAELTKLHFFCGPPPGAKTSEQTICIFGFKHRKLCIQCFRALTEKSYFLPQKTVPPYFSPKYQGSGGSFLSTIAQKSRMLKMCTRDPHFLLLLLLAFFKHGASTTVVAAAVLRQGILRGILVLYPKGDPFFSVPSYCKSVPLNLDWIPFVIYSDIS